MNLSGENERDVVGIRKGRHVDVVERHD